VARAGGGFADRWSTESAFAATTTMGGEAAGSGQAEKSLDGPTPGAIVVAGAARRS
jgi:hypothetical protein